MTAQPGPWRAVIADQTRTIYPDFKAALDAHSFADDVVTISVRRDSALPDGDGDKLPTAWLDADCAYEITAELIDDVSTNCGAEVRYAQARAMASGLNAVQAGARDEAIRVVAERFARGRADSGLYVHFTAEDGYGAFRAAGVTEVVDELAAVGLLAHPAEAS